MKLVYFEQGVRSGFEQEGQNFRDAIRYFITIKQSWSQLSNFQVNAFVHTPLLLHYAYL